MASLTLRFALIALALLVVVGGLWWTSKRPSRSRMRGGRLRMPVFVPLGGGLLVAISFILGMLAFTSRYTRDLLPLRVASVVVMVAGAAMLLSYRNRWVEVERDRVRFRTAWGRERVIAYDDVVEHRFVRRGGHEVLKVRSRQGVRLRLDLHLYPAPSLVAAVSAGG